MRVSAKTTNPITEEFFRISRFNEISTINDRVVMDSPVHIRSGATRFIYSDGNNYFVRSNIALHLGIAMLKDADLWRN